jgi:hypothetical protein
MGHRLAALAAAQQRLQLRLFSGQRRFAEGQNPGPRPAGHVPSRISASRRGLSLCAQAGDRLRSHC